MRKFSLALLISLFLFSFLAGCVASNGVNREVVYGKPVLATSPNWEYIKFNDLDGIPNNHVDIIDNTIFQWESANSDREIISVQIVYQQNAYLTGAKTLGISIYSKKVR